MIAPQIKPRQEQQTYGLKIQYPEWGASHVQDRVNVSSKTHAFKQLVLAVTETYHLEDQFTSIWVKNSKSNKVFAQSCQKPQSIPFGHKKSKPLTTTTFGRFCQDFLQLSKKVFCHPMLQIFLEEEKKIRITFSQIRKPLFLNSDPFKSSDTYLCSSR